jgi:hypothetical protein
MSLIHIKTVVQTLLVKPDDKGNGVELPPLQVTISEFSEEEFKKAFSLLAAKREELVSQFQQNAAVQP